MKSVIRLVVFSLMVSGWALAAMCLHIVRTPNPSDPTQSNFVVVPKDRIGVNQTYVDARGWTLADLPAHSDLMARLLSAGKADQFKFLVDPKKKEDVQAQLTDALTGKNAISQSQPTTIRSSMRLGKM
ncbi:MAG: hypothetical protein M3O30_19115 [Planctomycetota bacterium]|nr:hypothetical protein [Planctomycetota bacterium]